jgi:hypothetical protein
VTAVAARPLLAMVPVLGLLQGCLPGEPVRLPVTRASGRDLTIWTVATRRVEEGLLVHGVVRGAPLALGPIHGHLHVVATPRDGGAPIVVDTNWGSMSGGKSRLADFYATVPVADTRTLAAVSVAYVATSDAATPNLDIKQ